MRKIQFGILGLLAAALLSAAVAAESVGTWSKGAVMPSERGEVAAAELDGKIYVVGGFGGERDLEIYDPAADKWSRGAKFPREIHHTAAVGLNGKLYVIGGYVLDWVPTNAVYEYDPVKDSWGEGSPLDVPRGAL